MESDEVQGLYMQIANPSAEVATDEDEEEESVTFTIVPPSVTEAVASTLGASTAGTETVAFTAAEVADEDRRSQTETQAFFAAVSACSNLHPDPNNPNEMDEDYDMDGQRGSGLIRSGLILPGSNGGGLPLPLDGSSGWITAENMHEFFDEEGNWVGGEETSSTSLGPGAGLVRARESGAEDDGPGTDGEYEETKWRKTD
jgi:chloride channel, nucleotide-sensitive, 1A